MKSVVTAFSQFQTAISSALNFALVAVNVEQRFTWLFGSFGIIAWIFGILFYFTWVNHLRSFLHFYACEIDQTSYSFYKLDQQEVQLNLIGTGERDGFKNEKADPERRTEV